MSLIQLQVGGNIILSICRDALFSQPRLDSHIDHIANLAEFGQRLLFCAFEPGWVFEGPVQSLVDTRPDGWAVLVSIVTDSYQVFKVDLAQIITHALCVVPGHINAGFLHDLDREGIDAFWFKTGAMDFKTVPGVPAQEGFCYLAAGGVAGA